MNVIDISEYQRGIDLGGVISSGSGWGTAFWTV